MTFPYAGINQIRF